MKLIGLLGGLGWETSSLYYRLLNEFTQRQLGDRHAARILLHSVNNGVIADAITSADSDQLISILSDAGRSLKHGGADFMVLASNSMHQYAEEVEQASGLELLHISDTVSVEIRRAGHRRVALLGTQRTMEGGFYQQRLHNHANVEILTPESAERLEVNRIIFEELAMGVMRTGSREFLGGLIHELCDGGAEAVVLGCSELTNFLTPARDAVPFYDTTRLHTKAAVQRALEVTYA